jgi:hypothetical protein
LHLQSGADDGASQPWGLRLLLLLLLLLLTWPAASMHVLNPKPA